MYLVIDLYAFQKRKRASPHLCKMIKNATMALVLSFEALVDERVLVNDYEVALDLSDYARNRKHCHSPMKL